MATEGSAKKLHVTVVTPAGQAYKGEAEEVSAPGQMGELGVLPGHIPLLAVVEPGVLAIKAGGHKDVLAVGAGYLQVGAGDQVKLLVERATKRADVDVEKAKQELAAAEAELKAGGDGASAAEARRKWAQARVNAAAGAAADKH